MPLDPNRAYGLHPQVALREEAFGALAYHYGNRRLTFLKSRELLDVVRDLDRHPSLADALAAGGVPAERSEAFLRALATLETSEVIGVR